MEFEYISKKEVIVKDNNEIIGNIMLGQQSENVFRILRVFVSEKYRGQGIAGTLMDFLVKTAKQQNFLLVPVCSFAVLYFEKNQQERVVLFSGGK